MYLPIWSNWLKTPIFAVTGKKKTFYGSILGLNGPEFSAQNLDENKETPISRVATGHDFSWFHDFPTFFMISWFCHYFQKKIMIFSKFSYAQNLFSSCCSVALMSEIWDLSYFSTMIVLPLIYSNLEYLSYWFFYIRKKQIINFGGSEFSE